MINTSVFLYNITTVFTDYFSTHYFPQSITVRNGTSVPGNGNINWCSTLCLNVVIWSTSICKWSVWTICTAAYSTYIMWAQWRKEAWKPTAIQLLLHVVQRTC